jgi:hypothetical protein
MCEIYDDGNLADVYNTSERRAAKPHRCEACGTVILPGERYTYGSGVFDHRGFSERACLACAKVRKDFGAAHAYYPSFNELEQSLHDCIAEGDPESLAWKVPLDAMRARGEDYNVKRVATLAFVKLVEERRER